LSCKPRYHNKAWGLGVQAETPEDQFGTKIHQPSETAIFVISDYI